MPPHGRKRAKCSVVLHKQTAETFKKSPVTRAVVVRTWRQNNDIILSNDGAAWDLV